MLRAPPAPLPGLAILAALYVALWKHITTAGEYLTEFIRRHREQHS